MEIANDCYLEYLRVLGELSTSCKNMQTPMHTETRSELVTKAIKAADQLGTSTIPLTAATSALSVIGVKAHEALEGRRLLWFLSLSFSWTSLRKQLNGAARQIPISGSVLLSTTVQSIWRNALGFTSVRVQPTNWWTRSSSAYCRTWWGVPQPCQGYAYGYHGAMLDTW